MFPYLLTFLYILGICALSSGETQYFRKLELLNQIKKEDEQLRYYIKSLTAQSNYFDFINDKKESNNLECTSSQKLDKKQTSSPNSSLPRKRNRSLSIDILRPPDNSRINLYAFLLESESFRNHQFSWFSILSRLIVQEYLTKNVLSEYTQEDVNNLLLAIIENKQKLFDLSLNDFSPEALLQLSFQDKALSNLLSHLLVGGEDFPSILCFLDFTPKKSLGFCKLNFLFLDSCILKAIFTEPSIVDSLQKIQQKILSEILEREETFQLSSSNHILKTRTDFKKELKEAVLTVLLDKNYNIFIEKNIFDFSLGKVGSYFLIKESQSHCISRVKYFYPENTWVEIIS